MEVFVPREGCKGKAGRKRKEKKKKTTTTKKQPSCSSTLKVKWMLIENSNQSEKPEQQKKHRKGLPGGRKSLAFL